MAENPLIHLPKALPTINKVNALRRRVVTQARSFDIINWENTSYGNGKLQAMDIHELNDLCPRDGWPTVVLIHGGGWEQGDKSDLSHYAPLFAKKGIMACSINYRLAPDHKWPTQLDDLLQSIAFIREQQVDLQRIALWGISAGGHLALMAALQQPEWFKCVVTIGAPTDLTTTPAGLGTTCFSENQRRIASPFHHSGTLPPTLILHGELDRVVPPSQAEEFHRTRPNDTTLMLIKDGDHGLRWPLINGWRAKRKAISWVVDTMDLPPRGSKWKRRKKKNR